MPDEKKKWNGLRWPTGETESEPEQAAPEPPAPKHDKEEGPTREDNRDLFFDELKKKIAKQPTAADKIAEIREKLGKKDIDAKTLYGKDQTIDVSRLPKQ